MEGKLGIFGGAISDSEAEDENSRVGRRASNIVWRGYNPTSFEKVTLPDRYVGKGNAKSQQSAMKLTELGPRLTLELYKVENGVNEGDILYHRFIQKDPAEAAKAKAKVSI